MFYVGIYMENDIQSANKGSTALGNVSVDYTKYEIGHIYIFVSLPLLILIHDKMFSCRTIASAVFPRKCLKFIPSC